MGIWRHEDSAIVACPGHDGFIAGVQDCAFGRV